PASSRGSGQESLALRSGWIDGRRIAALSDAAAFFEAGRGGGEMAQRGDRRARHPSKPGARFYARVRRFKLPDRLGRGRAVAAANGVLDDEPLPVLGRPFDGGALSQNGGAFVVRRK